MGNRPADIALLCDHEGAAHDVGPITKGMTFVVDINQATGGRREAREEAR